jgi:hypothetical protein
MPLPNTLGPLSPFVFTAAEGKSITPKIQVHFTVVFKNDAKKNIYNHLAGLACTALAPPFFRLGWCGNDLPC